MSDQLERRHAVAAQFEPIALDALNAKAAMLERLDNKYVVTADVLGIAAQAFAAHFDVLEIDGKRCFGYDTWYFDDHDLTSYYDHLRGRRRRMKVRMRRYLDAKLCYVEVKLKTKRGITVKKRLPIPYDDYGVLGTAGYDHVRQAYNRHYGGDFSNPLTPTLHVYYERMTLVAKMGGERMTIDSGLRFKNEVTQSDISDDFYIVETKSANGNGIADKILRGLHQHPAGPCSKYCIGLASTNAVSRYNRFLPALRKLDALRRMQSLPDATAKPYAA